MKQMYNLVWGKTISNHLGEKTVWHRVGVLLIDGDKISLHLDTIPAGGWDGWLKAFPRDDARDGDRRQANGQQPAPRGGGAFDIDEDVPF